MMKGIRRSIKGEKNQVPNISHTSLTQKSAMTILPPKKVIKAQYEYNANGTDELSFAKGDFFHVVGRENDTEWYEACNPMTGARGLVPVSFFKSLGKTERDSGDSSDAANLKSPDADSGFSEKQGDRHRAAQRQSTQGNRGGSPLYGVVMYDFNAERADELDAAAGEAIIVIAQSNKEWFVAKPIGRLGGPGLIPVAFIEIRDMVTGKPVENTEEAIARAGVPRVEEWKKMAADYKNSSISLGKFDSREDSNVASQMQNISLSGGNSRASTQQSFANADPGYGNARPVSQQQQFMAAISASVPRFLFNNDRYWFVVLCQMEDGQWWELCRYYEDFYDFQIALLEEFKVEAGRTGQERVLPYMPGPVTYVTEKITEQRRKSLDAYLKALLAMPTYISKSRLVRQLFAHRSGDVRIPDQNRQSQASQQSSDSSQGPSRQGSRADLNGNQRTGTPSYPSVLSPPPRQGSQPRMGNGAPINGQLRNSGDMAPPRMLRNDSSMSAVTMGSQVSQQGSIIVKVHFQEDVIATRVAPDVTFNDLQNKLFTRLQTKLEVIRYKDEQTGTYFELRNDDELAHALSQNSKLVLYVQ